MERRAANQENRLTGKERRARKESVSANGRCPHLDVRVHPRPLEITRHGSSLGDRVPFRWPNQPTRRPNKWIYRLVVTALGLVAIFVTGVLILKAIDNQTPIPDALVAIGSRLGAALDISAACEMVVSVVSAE